jgi:hypothetical protein
MHALPALLNQRFCFVTPRSPLPVGDPRPPLTAVPASLGQSVISHGTDRFDEWPKYSIGVTEVSQGVLLGRIGRETVDFPGNLD